MNGKNNQDILTEDLITDSKTEYERIKVPEDLNKLVNEAILEAGNQHIITKKKSKEDFIMKKRFKFAGVAAAALISCFLIGINTNEAFAKSLEDVPVLSKIVKVLTIRSYTEKKDNVITKVEVPEIQTDELGQEGNAAIKDVNAEIQTLMDEYVADANLRIEEYKQAFLETGGTEEQWQEKNIEIDVNYEIKSQTDEVLSLVINANESWAAVYGVQYFYNIDLKTGNQLKLKDVLGEKYIKIANEAIIKGMEENVKNDPDLVYWGHAGDSQEEESNIDGFVTVDDTTKFYLNEKGEAVVVFDKYEIAPGFMGAQEFVIRQLH